jgi:threonine dehydrogenase-like Zn-dependent dehydrogenase
MSSREIEPIRVGIIGCGNVALRSHARGYRSVPGVEIAAAADVTPERLAAAQSELGLAAYASAATGREVCVPLRRDDPVYRLGARGVRELERRSDRPVWSKGIVVE